MKFKVLLPLNSLKGLDIDLHLQSPSRKKVASLLNQLNEFFMTALPKSKLKNVTHPISDDTEVVRYDLKGIDKEKRAEIKEIIKYANRDNFFVFMAEDDSIDAIINDYEIIRRFNFSSEVNINNLLKDSFYVLNFKIEDIEENVKKPYARREARTDSPEVERQENIQGQKAKLESLFNDFLQQIKRIDFSDKEIVRKNQSEDNIQSKTKMPLKQMVAGDFFVTDRDRVSTVYEIISIASVPNSSDVELTFKAGGRDTNTQRIDGNQQFFKLKFREADDEIEYEVFRPQKIDWKTLVNSAQSFPVNLLPERIDYNKKRDLKELWDKMIAVVKKDDIELQKTRAQEQFEKRVSEENYRGDSKLWYLDKSGYKVNLSKYFAKLLEVPPRVPKDVREAYEKAFEFLKQQSSEILARIQKGVEDQDWSLVSNLSSLLNDYGTKRFNSNSERLLEESNYDRARSSSLSRKKALLEIEEFIQNFKDRLQAVNE